MSGREAGATSDARPGAVSDAVSGRERMGAAVRTPRLVLRRPTTADAAFHHALHSDPAVYAHSPSAREPDPEANARVLQGWIDHWDQEGFGYWVAELASPGGEGPPVGFVGVRRDGDALNLYYRFAPPGARGSVADTDPAATRGLGREAARAAVAWATQWLPQVRVQAVCKQTNAPAVATALSAGLLPDGAQDAGDGSMFGRWVSPRFEVTGGAPGVAGSGPADAAGADGPVELCEEEVAELLDVWERVVRTGGSVGFRQDAPRSAIAATLERQLAATRAGEQILVRMRAPDGRLLGFAWWVRGPRPLRPRPGAVAAHGRSGAAGRQSRVAAARPTPRRRACRAGRGAAARRIPGRSGARALLRRARVCRGRAACGDDPAAGRGVRRRGVGAAATRR